MDTITLTRAEYQELIDARDHAIAMRNVAIGATETLGAAELDAFLTAATPLAFWRRHRGLTEATLAAQAGIPQDVLATSEAGTRAGTVGDLIKLARALRVRIEDLIVDE